MKPSHRPRSDPYPDETDELFCEECQTLCIPGSDEKFARLCACCLADQEPPRSG